MTLKPSSWLGESLRRRWLDDDLEALAGRMEGRGLVIGSGHDVRRGRFRPQPAPASICLDLRVRPKPDIIGGAQRLSLAARTFDMVVCSEVAEYIPRPAQALAEIARVLKPGGRLMVATPFLHRADAADDLWRFTEAGLRRLLAEGGFRVVEIPAQGAALEVAANILRYSVMAIPQRALRAVAGALAYLPLRALAAADRSAARAMPVLASFSTGYLALAIKQGDKGVAG